MIDRTIKGLTSVRKLSRILCVDVRRPDLPLYP
jgi:hypothetical protein